MKLLAVASFLFGILPLAAQQEGRSAYAQSWDAMLHRAAGNHSPAPDEIAAAGSPSLQPDARAVSQAIPEIRRALKDPDTAVRTYALTSLVGLQLAPPAPEPVAPASQPAPAATAVSDKPDPPAIPTFYKPEIASALAPAIPEIGQELTDETALNRILAASALAGFAPAPPPSVFVPLLAYLRRDDGIGPTGAAVVDDLLQFTPISAETSAALTRYLRRSDQTADSRSSLVDSICSHPNQSQSLNKALLAFLNTGEPSMRARLILSLPQLDLAPDVFADTRALIAIVASDDQENLQVRTAAKAVTLCWTATRMPAGCPVY